MEKLESIKTEYTTRRNANENYPEATLWKILYDLSSALDFLQKLTRPILHHDIKLENVLIDETQNVYKLCDFGVAADYDGFPVPCSTRGTDEYMAPVCRYFILFCFC